MFIYPRPLPKAIDKPLVEYLKVDIRAAKGGEPQIGRAHKDFQEPDRQGGCIASRVGRVVMRSEAVEPL